MTDDARRGQDERTSGTAAPSRRVPVLLLAVVSLMALAVVGAVAFGVRSNPSLPESMSGVRVVPGTDLVIDLDGLGLIAADLPPLSSGRIQIGALNSPSGALHVEFGSREVVERENFSSEGISEQIASAVAKSETGGTGELALSVEFVRSAPDRDPPVRYYVVYSGALGVVCYVQMKDDRDPLEVSAPIFRAMRPSRPGESVAR